MKEKYDLHIFKDKLTSYTFNRSSPILFVNITGNVNAGEVNTAVEILKNTSSLVKSQVPGKVYRNVNVWVGSSGFANPKNIKEAEIAFRVENSWISSNNIKSSNITLVRWDGNKWYQLETSEKTKDKEFTYYKAKTNEFTYFAITQIEGGGAYFPSSAIQSEIPATAPVEAASAIAPPINLAIIIGWFVIIGFIITLHIKRSRNFRK